jgi:hypothetical protein
MFSTINTPISQNQKIIISSVYASALEINDTKNDYIYGIHRPDSRIKEVIKEISPFTKSTFLYNDT